MHPIFQWLRRERPPRQFPLSDFERISQELRPCDVVLVEGRTRVSDVIRWLTNSPWTHAALFVGRLQDIEDEKLRREVLKHYQGDPAERLVIESLLGHGTVVRPLAQYNQEHLRICRPARLSLIDAAQVVRYAISQIGKAYDVRQILDLARFLFPWLILPRRWASSLFIHNAGRREKTVCSTMIAEAFGFVNFPILPLVKKTEDGATQLFRRNPKLCTPSDFDYSPYFEIIKYPFLDFYHEDYQLLPWKSAGLLGPDEAAFYIEPSYTEPNDTEPGPLDTNGDANAAKIEKE